MNNGTTGRLRVIGLNLLFPRVAQAEIVLFFYIGYLHAVSHYAVIWDVVVTTCSDIRSGFLGPLQDSGVLLGIFPALLNAIMIVFPCSIFLMIALLPMILAYRMVFPGKTEGPAAKGTGLVALFYLITSILVGYLLMLHTSMSRIFASDSLLDTVQYAVLWLFGIRQILCALGSLLLLLECDSPWGEKVLASRMQGGATHRPTLLIGLIGATVVYIHLRITYEVQARVVIFGYVYGYALLVLLRAGFSFVIGRRREGARG